MYGFFVSWDEKKVASVENRPLAEAQVYHIITAYFSLPSPVTTILLLSGDHAISFMGPLRGWYSYFSKCSSCVVSQILSFPETSETWMLLQQINPFILGKLADIPSLKLFKPLSFLSRIKPNFKKSFLAYKTSQVTHWLEHSGAHVCKKILDEVKQTSTGRPKQPGTKIIFVKPTCNMVQSALQCHLSPAKVEVNSVRRKRSRYSETTCKNWGTTHSDIVINEIFFLLFLKSSWLFIQVSRSKLAMSNW